MGSIIASEERQLVRMKIAFIWLCFLHVSFASAGLFTRRNDLQTTQSNVSVSRAQAPQRLQPPSTGSLNQGRQRPLFARRGQYERQRIQVPKKVPVPPNDISPPSKVPRKTVKPKCSQLKQSCLPLSGCCDRFTTCHCRFFNAICFCRRTNS